MKVQYRLNTPSTDYIYTHTGDSERLIGIPKTGKRAGSPHHLSLSKLCDPKIRKRNEKLVCRVLRRGNANISGVTSEDFSW